MCSARRSPLAFELPLLNCVRITRPSSVVQLAAALFSLSRPAVFPLVVLLGIRSGSARLSITANPARYPCYQLDQAWSVSYQQLSPPQPVCLFPPCLSLPVCSSGRLSSPEPVCPSQPACRSPLASLQLGCARLRPLQPNSARRGGHFPRPSDRAAAAAAAVEG